MVSLTGRKLQISNIAPVVDILIHRVQLVVPSQAKDKEGETVFVKTWVKISKTHQTTQILAPGTPRPPDVKVLEQYNRSDQRAQQRKYPHKPPQPPEWSSTLEEPYWSTGESSEPASCCWRGTVVCSARLSIWSRGREVVISRVNFIAETFRESWW